MATTTIRVPQDVHARLVERARAEKKAISVVISEALDAEEDQKFWHDVRQTMTTPEARRGLQEDAEKLSGAIRSRVDPEDDWSHLL